ncbi:YdbC family protein [Youngiibacter multivorans]|uniref:Transcriptional coactivator p15 (PC4) C-terminal domain-containing protein n=1 Tax=Youngiibacter multivorans TaxID=937251 RepID=A0ABS4G8G6_9CLOT|nr:PC4/YdbC family ssDNA-binding protein [Youngiibacter multivorans]MBP1920847.1 hypothetical protein [Youngiibacter multivorans]
MTEIKYDVAAKYGVLSTSKSGWTKEVRSISWNDKEAKFDIREWAPGDEKMVKGITLSTDEMRELKRILNGLDL